MTEEYLEFRRFKVSQGQAHSQTGQQDADDFAADFQGLRHFSEKIGEALNLGSCSYAALREPSFSMIFAITNERGDVDGGMIDANLSHHELVQYLTQVEPETTEEQ